MRSPVGSSGTLQALATLFILLLPLASEFATVPDFTDLGDGLPAPAEDPPFVTDTNPDDGSVGVPLWAWITITFSRPMNASNVVFPVEPLVALTPAWYNSNSTLILRHPTNFDPCTTYRIYVDGSDLQGQGVLLTPRTPGPPNPWTFTTTCNVFTITRTDPEDNQTGVVVNGAYQEITVWFSRAADPPTLQVTLSPAIPLVPRWANGNTKVILGHSEWLYDCTRNSVTVSVRDGTGNPLVNVSSSAPNPWHFETACIPPVILGSDPANASTEVPLDAPIVVTFNKPMDIGSVSWSLLPGGLPLNADWSIDHRVLTLAHSFPFPLSTTFDVTIGGRDTNGADLAPGPVPNPWSFTTSVRVAAPGGLQVARVPPNIVLTWRAVPGAMSYAVYSSPDRFAPWPWPKLADNLGSPTYVHAGADSDGASHYYVVRASAPLGGEGANSTMGVKVALVFTFSGFRSNVHWLSLPYRSTYRSAKDISDALTETRIDVIAKWNPATQTPILWYFLRGAWRGTDFPLVPGDGFYIGVLSSFSWAITGTDRAIIHSFATVPPSSPTAHWMGLPCTVAYARASDVVRGIEGGVGPNANSRIVEIGTWDPIAERLVTFWWSPTGWTGTDFRIEPGRGLYLRIVSDFAWAPELIAPDVP